MTKKEKITDLFVNLLLVFVAVWFAALAFLVVGIVLSAWLIAGGAAI